MKLLFALMITCASFMSYADVANMSLATDSVGASCSDVFAEGTRQYNSGRTRYNNAVATIQSISDSDTTHTMCVKLESARKDAEMAASWFQASYQTWSRAWGSCDEQNRTIANNNQSICSDSNTTAHGLVDRIESFQYEYCR